MAEKIVSEDQIPGGNIVRITRVRCRELLKSAFKDFDTPIEEVEYALRQYGKIAGVAYICNKLEGVIYGSIDHIEDVDGASVLLEVIKEEPEWEQLLPYLLLAAISIWRNEGYHEGRKEFRLDTFEYIRAFLPKAEIIELTQKLVDTVAESS